MISELWDRLDPGFLAPIWLLVGLLALLALLLLEIGARRRRTQAIRLFAASHLITALTASVSPARRLFKHLLLLSAVALLFIAMARPYLLYDWREENRTGFDILLAVDCSKSMLTEDVKPNRLERAKLAIADFADRLPDNRLGLIAFAGDAFLQCPLTLDHEAFQNAVRELDTTIIPRPGTDIATAIDEAVSALANQPNNLKILILVTDGEDLEGRVLDAAKSAAQTGLKIYTVGVGTPNGGTIPELDDNGNPDPNNGPHRDPSGEIVVSKLDEDTLRQIASITGGAYVPLGQSGEGLDEIYNRYIAPLPKQNLEERREKIHLERFEWPLAVAILFLIAEFMITERATAPAMAPAAPARRSQRRRDARNAPALVPLALLALLLSTPVHAADVDTAEQDYKSGKYDDALQNYRSATRNQPTRDDLQYNRGDAAYKAGQYTEAEEAFLKALETPDLNLQEQTYYNLGNTQFKDGEAMQKVDTQKTIDLWEKALHSYDSALKLKTTADATHNYEVVKEKLEQLKKQQQQQQQNNNGPSNPDQQNQSGQDSQQNQGNASQQPPNQQGQNNPQNGQNSSQPQQPSGNKPDQGKPSASAGQDQKDKPSSDSKNPGDTQARAYSGARQLDKQDPGVKSREEAEALLDSLKDDERHVTARSLNANNETPPPPPSGKDW
jgi:Ca-activated chloride channel family protein